MSVDVLYVSHNRLSFTQATFQALIENTNWELVGKLIVIDDHSTDGTGEWLIEAVQTAPVARTFVGAKVGGPVAALNRGLDISEADYLAKIDNDLVVCPQWLDHMHGVLSQKRGVDALGMEPGFGERVRPLDHPRRLRSARWIGGIGLFRTKTFVRRRPSPHDRWFGLTQFWRKHCHTAWITPDLPIFLLDHLDVDPWRALAEQYVMEGWSRRWTPYSAEMADAYAGWWLKQEAVA